MSACEFDATADAAADAADAADVVRTTDTVQCRIGRPNHMKFTVHQTLSKHSQFPALKAVY